MSFAAKTQNFSNLTEYSSDYFFDDTNLKISPIHSKNQNSAPSPIFDNKKKSPRISKKYFNSIFTSQKCIEISKLRSEVTKLKNHFINEFSDFQKTLSKTHDEIRKCFLLSPSQTYANDKDKIIKEKDEEINRLRSEVVKLEYFCESESTNSFKKDLKFQEKQDEIDSKNEYIKLKEKEHQEKIHQLNAQIKEQQSAINSFQNQKFQINHLQSQLENKTKENEQLKNEYIQKNEELNRKIEQNQNAANKIENSFIKINELQDEIDHHINEKSILKNELSNVKNELELTKSQNSQLKHQIEDENNQKEKLLEKISKKKQQLLEANEKYNQLSSDYDECKNELSLMEIQNSFQQLSPTQTLSNSPSNSQSSSSNTSPIKKSKYKEYKKLKIENINLKAQLEMEIQHNIEQKKLINALKANIEASENQILLLNEKKQSAFYSLNRQENLTSSLEQEIKSLKCFIAQKEKMINDLISIDEKKSDQIKRLHFDLQTLFQQSQRNQSSIDETTFDAENESSRKQFEEISKQLYDSKKFGHDMEIKAKKQSHTIRALTKANNYLREQINDYKKKLSQQIQGYRAIKLSYENLNSEYINTSNNLLSKLKSVQNELEEVTNQNLSYIQQNTSLQSVLSKSSTKIDEMTQELLIIRNENNIIQNRVNIQYLPLQNENERLKEYIEKLRKHKNIITEENIRLSHEVESMKKEKEIEQAILQTQLIENNEDLSHVKNDSAIINLEYQKYKNEIMCIYSYFNTNSIDHIIEELKKKDITLQKKSEEIRKLKEEHSTMKINFSKMKNELASLKKEKESATQTIKTLTSELSKKKKEVESLNTFKQNSEEMSFVEKNEVSNLQNELKSLRTNLTEQQEKIKSLLQLNSLPEFWGFNIEELVEHLIKENNMRKDNEAHLNSQVAELSKSFQKEKSQAGVILHQFELIKSQNEYLSKSLNEARQLIKNESSASNQSIIDKQAQIDLLFNENEAMKLEFNKFHSLFSFSNNADLFNTVSDEMDKKKLEIEKLQFDLQTTIASSESKINELNCIIKKQQNKINIPSQA